MYCWCISVPPLRIQTRSGPDLVVSPTPQERARDLARRSSLLRSLYDFREAANLAARPPGTPARNFLANSGGCLGTGGRIRRAESAGGRAGSLHSRRHPVRLHHLDRHQRACDVLEGVGGSVERRLEIQFVIWHRRCP
jgi:hypothetical protein